MSATFFVRCLVFVLSAWQVAEPLQWTDDVDNTSVHVCRGQDMSLLWNFTKSAGQVVSFIEWFYRGQSEELIATYAHDHFVPTASFAHRVQFSPPAGITLLAVQPGDKGNYSVEVSSHEGGNSFVTQRRSVTMEFSVPPTTDYGDLHVELDEVAVYDTDTDQWSVQLTCGQFSSLGQPPATVVWTLPDGSTRNSSSYENGDFHLLLSRPVKGGNYMCSLSPQYLASSCLPSASPLNQGSALHVSPVIASVAVLQAEKAELEADLREKESNMTRLEQQVTNLTQQLTVCNTDDKQYCDGVNYTVVDDYTRDINFTTITYHCDRDGDIFSDTPAWYRFYMNGTDAVIPTTCVQPYHCNAGAAMWLNLSDVSLPGPGQEVIATACASYHGCCHWNDTVTVRNCGQYFLYELVQPYVCDLRYCIQVKES